MRYILIIAIISVFVVVSTASRKKNKDKTEPEHGQNAARKYRPKKLSHVNKIYNPDFKSAAVVRMHKQKCKLNRRRNAKKTHRALIDETFKWPKATVPFKFGALHNYFGNMSQVIQEAFNDIMATTCVRFAEWTGQKDYVEFKSSDFFSFESYSHMGRQGGPQELVLHDMAVKGTIIHELLHLLGFEHEHSRIDRDQYIRVHYENIDPENWDQFDIQNASSGYPTETLGIPYSYTSIMHYAENLAALNDSIKTLEPLLPLEKGVVIGQLSGLDESDIARINLYYKCEGSESHFEEAGYRCKDLSGSSLSAGQTVVSNGYLLACNGTQAHYDSQTETVACVNSSGTIFYNGDEFYDRENDGTYVYRCKIEEYWRSKDLIGCINSTGNRVKVGEIFREKTTAFRCQNMAEWLGCMSDSDTVIAVGQVGDLNGQVQRCEITNIRSTPLPGGTCAIPGQEQKTIRGGEFAAVGSKIVTCYYAPYNRKWVVSDHACLGPANSMVLPGSYYAAEGYVFECMMDWDYNVVHKKVGCHTGKGTEYVKRNQLYTRKMGETDYCEFEEDA